MTEKPRIFIASSSDQIGVATRIAAALKEPSEWTIHVWDKSFRFSDSYIESLENELELADFAVVVLTGDDAANVHKTAVVLPRDNVIFELGLFIGRLGRSRCFFFVDAESGTKIASDLSGVKPVSFYPDAVTTDHKPSLKTRVKLVKKQLRELGVRYKPNKKAREQQEALWRFSRRIVGHWWERMRDGEDDQSALSYVALTTDEATSMLHLDGQAYGLSGEFLAEWESIASRIVLGDKPRISYLWTGHHLGAHGQELAGSGVVDFDDNDRLERARGYYYDTNFTAIKDGVAPTHEKNFRLYRCAADEIEKMTEPTSAEAKALISERLKTLRW